MSTDTELLFSSPLQTYLSQDNCRDDFSAWLARETALPTDDVSHLDILRYLSERDCSVQTSTVVQTQSEYDLESMASDNVPALTRGNSVASTSSVTNTDMASVIDGGFVLESEDGVLTVPARMRPDADLLCPFQILGCHECFSDVIEFKVHTFSHFRGYPLPQYAPCFLCRHPFFQGPEDDNALAWNNLLNHMAYDHYRNGIREFTLKPDIAIMRYMWDRNIISDAEFKRTQLQAPQTHVAWVDNQRSGFRQVPEAPMAPSAPIPTEIRQHLNSSVGSHGEPFTVSAGRRQDRRQTDRLRLMARVRGSNL